MIGCSNDDGKYSDGGAPCTHPTSFSHPASSRFPPPLYLTTHRPSAFYPPTRTYEMLPLLTLAALYIAPRAVRATPCVAMDINWNLYAFGLDGKDWSAGTQDSWGSGMLSKSFNVVRTFL